MDNATFTHHFDQFVEACARTLIAKGAEYSGHEDRFANFKRGAALVGVQPTTILAIYLSKHYDSIMTFIRAMEASNGQIAACERMLTEPIAGRIMDAVNYLLLLHGMIIEARDADHIPTEG